jgi:hypothetical protein
LQIVVRESENGALLVLIRKGDMRFQTADERFGTQMEGFLAKGFFG